MEDGRRKHLEDIAFGLERCGHLVEYRGRRAGRGMPGNRDAAMSVRTRRSSAARRAFSMAARRRRRTSETSTSVRLASRRPTRRCRRARGPTSSASAIRCAGARRRDVDDAVANERAERIDHRAHAETPTALDGNRQLRDRAIENDLRTAGLLRSTSRAAMRPPADLGTRICATTARRAPGERSPDLRPAICRECIDQALNRAGCRCSRDRSEHEPTGARRIERGDERFGRPQILDHQDVRPSRSAARAALAIASPSPRTSRWLMNDSRFSCTRRICDSMVMT